MENKSKCRVINRDMLKFLAIIPMAIGHFCSYLSSGIAYRNMSPVVFVLIQLSMFAPPIFFFFIAEGYRYTHSRKKYALRLLIFAVITQFAFALANFGTIFTWSFFSTLNIVFTLFFGLLAIMVSDSKLKKPLKIILIILIDAATILLSCEWIGFGVLIMLAFHLFHDKPKKRFVAITVLILTMQTVMSIIAFVGWGRTIAVFLLQTAACFGGFLVIDKCYNGEKGKHPKFAKWFFYIFYPAHMLIIFAARALLGQF